MQPDEYENAMERSMLFWLRNEIPNVSAGGLTIPVKVLNCMPQEYYLKQRDTYALIDVDFSEISTEGYSLGGISGENLRNADANNAVSRNFPYRYNLKLNINIYAGSSVERAKLDGKLRSLFDDLRRGNNECPVYEWESDTSAVTASNTGTYITVLNNKDSKVIHSQDSKNSDFLSHWNINANCVYALDSIVELVSSIDVETTIEV